MAQQKKQSTKGFEIGIDVLPYIVQIGDDIPGLRKDWEVFFKSKMEKGGVRLKIGHYNEPIHEKKLFKTVQVTTACTDATFFKNEIYPYDFYFFTIGYEAKKNIKWLEIIYGLDLSYSRYKGQTIVRKVFCSGVINGEQIGGESLWRIIPKSNYFGLGATPFLGVRLPVLKRLNLTLETGVQCNFVLGDYRYLLPDLDEGYYHPNDFELNWGSLTSDIGISYEF